MTREKVEQEIGFDLATIASAGPRGLCLLELVSVYTTACAITPKVLVEIGSFQGVSSIILGFIAKKCGGVLYSYDCISQPRWAMNMQQFDVLKFAKFAQATSPNVTVDALPFKIIDYLLIDGDHHYEAALADYSFWSKLVRLGGRIVFHDYSSHAGVRRAVTELLEADPKLKIVEIVPGQLYNEPVGKYTEPGLIVLEKCRE